MADGLQLALGRPATPDSYRRPRPFERNYISALPLWSAHGSRRDIPTLKPEQVQQQPFYEILNRNAMQARKRFGRIHSLPSERDRLDGIPRAGHVGIILRPADRDRWVGTMRLATVLTALLLASCLSAGPSPGPGHDGGGFPPGSVGGAGAARGELLLGVLGPEALARDLDKVRAVGKAIEGRGGEQWLAAEVRPLGAVSDWRSRESRRVRSVR